MPNRREAARRLRPRPPRRRLRTEDGLLFVQASPRTDLDFAGRVPQLAELDAHTRRNGTGLLLSLEAREVRPLAPRERSAQALPRVDRGVVHRVDQTLVVGRALCVTREVAEVAGGREDRGHARN